VANRQAKTIFAAFKPIFEIYAKQGFHISILGVDNEFAALQADIQGMPGGLRVNLATASKHVPKIERRIRVVKENVEQFGTAFPLTGSQN
jgi:hypothetical protein